MANTGDPEDTELDPPVPGDDEPEDLQDDALVEDEADRESEPDQPDAAALPAQPVQPEQPQRQPSRGERRFQTLNNELQEQRRRNDDLNRRLDSLLAAQPRPQQESPEARAQRMALLTPEERITAELTEAKQGFAREMAQVRFTAADGSDKASYQAKATVDSLYRKWEPQVEAELVTVRNQGMNV